MSDIYTQVDNGWVPKSTRPSQVKGGVSNAPEFRQTMCRAAVLMEYYNLLPYPVRIIERSGLSKILPAASNLRYLNNTFKVDIFHTYKSDVKIDTNTLSDVPSKQPIAETVAMREAFRISEESNSYQGRTAAVSHVYSGEQLADADGSLYLDSLDIVITTRLFDMSIKHPESSLGRLFTAWEDNSVSYQWRLDIVDKFQKFGDRWINVHGHIYQVKAVTDNDREDGIYVYSGKPTDATVQGEPDNTVYYGFEEADTLPIYLTHSDALNFGNTQDTRKIELEQLVHDNKIELERMRAETRDREIDQATRIQKMADEHAQAKHLLAMDAARVAERAGRLEEDAARRDAVYAEDKLRRDEAMLQMKYKYEERSLDRKDRSEGVKHIPTIISGVGAAISAALLVAKLMG